MLLPSALSCDSSQPPRTRLQASLFASPPASPPSLSTQNAIGNIFNTCRSLQSLLTVPPPVAPTTPPSTSHGQLPTPPMAHAPSPMKLRLRSRKADNASPADPPAIRKRVVKRSVPRGLNKRRRTAADDMGRDDDDVDIDVDSDLEISHDAEGADAAARPEEPEDGAVRPHTPKRARIAPEVLPLGLERSDFHALHHADGEFEREGRGSAGGTDVVVEADGETWSTEEDRILVELVLEKLKLTKSDWQDCARSLGKDRGSVGRRWKSLMIGGDVGLKTSSRRARIHGTWR